MYHHIVKNCQCKFCLTDTLSHMRDIYHDETEKKNKKKKRTATTESGNPEYVAVILILFDNDVTSARGASSTQNELCKPPESIM